MKILECKLSTEDLKENTEEPKFPIIDWEQEEGPEKRFVEGILIKFRFLKEVVSYLNYRRRIQIDSNTDKILEAIEKGNSEIIKQIKNGNLEIIKNIPKEESSSKELKFTKNQITKGIIIILFGLATFEFPGIRHEIIFMIIGFLLYNGKLIVRDCS